MFGPPLNSKKIRRMHPAVRSPVSSGPLAALLCLGLLALPGAAASRMELDIDPALRAVLKKAVSESDSFGDRFEAEVWLTDMSRRLERRVPHPQFRVELLRHVHYEAKRAGLSPEVVLAVIDIESNFNLYAISSVGARGLMQVMPFWLKEIGQPEDSLFRLQTNLRYGCTILKYYLDKERGNLNLALRRYNGTREPAYSMKVDKLIKSRWYRQ
jgi:soluble lytic murein transglycosylase-like protein